MWSQHVSFLVTTTIASGVLICSAQNLSFATVASSPFDMRLSPTNENLDLTDVAAVEDAASHCLLQTSRQNTTWSTMVASFHVVAEQVIWQKAVGQHHNFSRQGSHQATTSFQFAVLVNLATTLDYLKLAELDSFILSAFTSQAFKSRFDKRLVASGNTILMNVVTVEVVALPHTPTNSLKPAELNDSSNSALLSKVDIFLLVFSGCIFLGVVYMIYRHHLDQGYIETQRMRVFSRPEVIDSYVTRPTTSPFGACHSPGAVDYFTQQPNKQRVFVVAPETPVLEDKKEPSTPSTADIAAESPDRMERPPTPVSTPPSSSLRRKCIQDGDVTETTITPSNRAMPEVFTSKWFKSQESLLLMGEDGERSSSCESDDLGDLFHINMEPMSPLSQDSGCSDKLPSAAAAAAHQSISSSKRTLSEWMKGIRVVLSETTLVATNNSMDRSSLAVIMEPSVEASLTDNNEHDSPYSLERSMASSTVVVELPLQQQLEI